MPPEKEPDKNPKPLRTYKSDVEEILKEGEGSFAKIAIAESEKRARAGFSPEETEAPGRAKLIVGISAGLIILGIAVLSAVYFFRSAPTPIATTAGNRPLIAADVEKKLDIAGLNRDQIINALTSERNSDTITLSSMLALKINDGAGQGAKLVSAPNFIARLQTRAPSELVRSLENDFMFGLHALNKNQPFLILKTSYYQNAFAGMLAWESVLRDDLGPIFIRPESAAVASTSTQRLNQSGAFEDMVVKNRDVRALRDKDGAVIFLYSFPDKNTIVITTNPDTLEQVSARLLAGKLVQ